MRPGQFFHQLSFRLRHGGLPWLVQAVHHRVWPARPALGPAAAQAVQDKAGLEIGGPSRVFRPGGILPLYPRARCLDNVNYAAQTAWEGGLRAGADFTFDRTKPPGRQFLHEATDLAGLVPDSYDFILSCHCLEHVANPLAALREWRRVTRDGGHLLLLLPDPQGTFDHRRPVTTLAHLREDFAGGTGEDDLTHLPEILALHDLTRDPPAGSPEQFAARGRNNAQERCLHHHVFDLALMRAALAETGWEVLAAEAVRPIHLVALAKKK